MATNRGLGFAPTDQRNYYFISYSREDAYRIAPIVTKLYEQGLALWYDAALEYGEEWETDIAERIQECKAVILFVSRKLFLRKQSYVYYEYKIARNTYNKKILVYLLDEIDPKEIPSENQKWWYELEKIHSIQAFDLSEEEQITIIQKTLSDMSLDSVSSIFKSKKGLLAITAVAVAAIFIGLFINQKIKVEPEQSSAIESSMLNHGEGIDSSETLTEHKKQSAILQSVSSMPYYYSSWGYDESQLASDSSEHRYNMAVMNVATLTDLKEEKLLINKITCKIDRLQVDDQPNLLYSSASKTSSLEFYVLNNGYPDADHKNYRLEVEFDIDGTLYGPDDIDYDSLGIEMIETSNPCVSGELRRIISMNPDFDYMNSYHSDGYNVNLSVVDSDTDEIVYSTNYWYDSDGFYDERGSAEYLSTIELVEVLDVDANSSEIVFSNPANPMIKENFLQFDESFFLETVICPTKSCYLEYHMEYEIEHEIYESESMSVYIEVPIYDIDEYELGMCLGSIQEWNPEEAQRILDTHKYVPGELKH